MIFSKLYRLLYLSVAICLCFVCIFKGNEIYAGNGQSRVSSGDKIVKKKHSKERYYRSGYLDNFEMDLLSLTKHKKYSFQEVMRIVEGSIYCPQKNQITKKMFISPFSSKSEMSRFITWRDVCKDYSRLVSAEEAAYKIRTLIDKTDSVCILYSHNQDARQYLLKFIENLRDQEIRLRSDREPYFVVVMDICQSIYDIDIPDSLMAENSKNIHLKPTENMIVSLGEASNGKTYAIANSEIGPHFVSLRPVNG